METFPYPRKGLLPLPSPQIMHTSGIPLLFRNGREASSLGPQDSHLCKPETPRQPFVQFYQVPLLLDSRSPWKLLHCDFPFDWQEGINGFAPAVPLTFLIFPTATPPVLEWHGLKQLLSPLLPFANRELCNRPISHAGDDILRPGIFWPQVQFQGLLRPLKRTPACFEFPHFCRLFLKAFCKGLRKPGAWEFKKLPGLVHQNTWTQEPVSLSSLQKRELKPCSDVL